MRKKIIIFIALSLMLVGLSQLSIKYFTEKELGLTKIVVASHTLSPRTKVTYEDLKEIEVPKAYLTENIYQYKEDIVNKYTLVDNYIFKNQMFFKESLEEEGDMSDYPIYLLDKGQVLYELEIDDIECSRNNLLSRQHVDIYLTVKDSKKVISDLLVKNVEIVAAYDVKGNSIKDKDSGNIYSIVLALNSDLINIVNVSKNKGKLSLYLNNNAYNGSKESILNKSSTVLNYLDLIE